MSLMSWAVLVAVACGARAQEGEARDPAMGIAAQYPHDLGLAKDRRVIFADDFEAWQTDGGTPPDGAWEIRHNTKPDQKQTLAVAGAVTINGQKGPGRNVLRLADHATGRDGTLGLRKLLGNYSSPQEGKGPGYEEVHVRFTMKFGDLFSCHGPTLGGRDATRPGARWVGQANTRDVASHGYFYSGVQPHFGPKPFWGFYSYHMDKRGGWGDTYKTEEREKKYIEAGRWYCVERRMKLNSVDPLQADGLEELWIDGVLAMRREGLRFRRAPQLRITVFALEVYHGPLPEKYTPTNPFAVYFDNVVVAKEYIGPIATRSGP